MTFPYTTGVPNPPNNPSQDVPFMQTNTNTINSWVQVDHTGFGNANGGIHKQVTFALNQAAPGFPNGVSDLFVNLVGGLSQLFFQNSAGVVPLTGSILVNSGTIAPNGNYNVFQTPWGLKFFTGNFFRNNGSSTYTLSGATFGATVYTTLASPTGQTNTALAGAFGMSAIGGTNGFTTYFSQPTNIFLNFLVITS